ncbi:MAG: MFS transporter [Candidatus Latescibacterota bacterium]|nr:MAG: MFS transporter [Candidatus Latescibacterota bacterium]
MSEEKKAAGAGPVDLEKKNATPARPNPLREIVQPFVDLVHAPRALWGINLAYVIEGMVYFGMLGYLAMHFSDFIFAGVEPSGLRDEYAHDMVAVLTAGITISMFFLGTVADKKGVRFALLGAFVLMLFGRVLISGAPTVLGLQPAGLWSSLHLLTMAGILLVVIGYGMYQPAAYAAVKQFTTPKTAGMGFAMLYALMNLGGWFPTYAFLLRDEKHLNLGIPGTFWVYTAFTLVALVSTWILLSRKTVADAIAAAAAERTRMEAAEKAAKPEEPKPAAPAPGAGIGARRVPFHMWVFALLILTAVAWKVPAPWGYGTAGVLLLGWIVSAALPGSAAWLVRHPLGDAKFFFFIFALIPVQTLFAYNWLILPQYISRAYGGWIGEYFEIASNANPILIFILVPIIAAATQTAKVYRMMILGTFIMAAPAFLLALGPHPWTLFPYILLMTIGEAMWQPRFLQYAAEIAPPGRTGEYMGVAQLPWFLTKVLVPLLYSGWMMGRYCPADGPKNTEFMWLVFGCIAISSSLMLFLARGWIGKDFKTKA